MKQEGLLVRVIDVFSIQPIDWNALIDVIWAAGGRAVTVEDHYSNGGLGDAVQSALSGERTVLWKMAVHEIPHRAD